MGRLHSTGVLVSVLAFSAICLGAQTLETAPPPQSRFEVVSIRPSGLHANANGSFHILGAVGPGEWRATGSFLPYLINYAYGLKMGTLDRVEGLPRWTQTAEYDITAIIPPHARQAQIPLMVRAMLANRFKLVAHWGTRPMQAATLTVAPGGPKLKPDPACDSPDLPVTVIALRPSAAATARNPSCGAWTRSPGIDGSVAVKFHGVTMAEMADYAASQTMPVIDHTGLKGAYDFTLTYQTVGFGGVNRDQWPEIDAENLRNRDDAFLKQLGLKLNLARPTKQPVPVLVVDHVETPTPN